MLDEAEEQGMVLYWGSKSFSVRMPLEQPVTVMCGYPPNEFQVYTSNWSLDSEGRAEFHQRLCEIAPFRAGGQYTNPLFLDEKTEQQAYTALVFMWDEVAKMMATAREDSQSGQVG